MRYSSGRQQETGLSRSPSKARTTATRNTGRCSRATLYDSFAFALATGCLKPVLACSEGVSMQRSQTATTVASVIRLGQDTSSGICIGRFAYLFRAGDSFAGSTFIGSLSSTTYG